jgi:signal transduction histidine kinase
VGLIPALERFLDEVRTSQEIEVDLELDCDERTRLSTDVETALYRISQEAITNSIRHGAASRIDVALRCNSNRVELSIRDNGVGFCPANIISKHSESSPFGLLSINERVRLLGGNAWIESEAGAGAHVRVQLPVAGTEIIDG